LAIVDVEAIVPIVPFVDAVGFEPDDPPDGALMPLSAAGPASSPSTTTPAFDDLASSEPQPAPDDRKRTSAAKIGNPYGNFVMANVPRMALSLGTVQL
jgi:hypothetical protein